MFNLTLRKASWITTGLFATTLLVACGGGGGSSGGGAGGGSGASTTPAGLDAKYAYNGDLGVTYDGNIPTLRVWAPTAKKVQVKLYDNATTSTVAETADLTFDATTGVWSVTGFTTWTGMYYLLRVNTGTTYDVTDPYSVSLSTDGKRSHFINLSSQDWKPADWDKLGVTEAKPELKSFTDMVIYELHVRDFSMNDTLVPAADRGKFTAFTQADTYGIRHLKRLKAAGFTHVHLLPAFDFASVIEDESKRKEPNIPANTTGASDVAAAQQATNKDQDGFNWGYDPVHYGVPEGSYATDPNGAQRVLEFRKMVQSVNRLGLRVVMDVVYNHTSENGAGAKSVFDKIVPRYYYRGTSDSCCPDTASEHRMMEKLMIDTLVRWAKDYKVDGFRFDLMGFHTKQNLLNIRSAIDQLTIAKDGVDGSKIYLYGEGWDFGGISNNPALLNADQINMAGTKIGTFNDRLRDAVRGGGPFSGYKVQGFSNSDEYKSGTMLYYGDLVRIGLAGSLQDYTLVDNTGTSMLGINLPYNGGKNAGYAKDPRDTINYVSAHDNETLFDNTQIKASSGVKLTDRIRMHVLAESVVALSQGIPFFHAGDEILRSKSVDRDSYNSGDWFNRIDYTYKTNNWAVGLPPADKNTDHYADISPLLKNTTLTPNELNIKAALAQFEEFIKIRRGSKLFRLDSASDIKNRVKFYNTGKAQTPGLIVMSIDDDATGQTDLDPAYSRVVVVINATAASLNYNNATAPWMGQTLALHPCLTASSDNITKNSQYSSGTFTVPARTTAVFVQVQKSALAICN